MNRLRFDALDVGYGRKTILESISGELTSGDWVHLFGRNGSGKTSLLQVLASFHYPIGGSVLWNGNDIHRNKQTYRSNIRYFGHEVSLYERLTVRDNWELFSGLFDLHGTAPRSFTEHIEPETPVEQLSRGQKRRVELASLIASPRELLIFDEPLASLDQEAVDSLIENLESIREDDGIILTASPEPLEHAQENWKVAGTDLVKVQ
jgi:heme ABC exporter ATP-binding subunit CcmA